MMDPKEAEIRETAAKIALFAYGMTVVTAIWALFKVSSGDTGTAVILALSAVLTLVSAIGFTMRARGY